MDNGVLCVTRIDVALQGAVFFWESAFDQ